MAAAPGYNLPDRLSDSELLWIIEKHLPAWLSACNAADSDGIVLHEAAFGTSPHELFLFACAIKYAAAKGKTVHIAIGTTEEKVTAKPTDGVAIVGTYRERRRRKSRST